MVQGSMVNNPMSSCYSLPPELLPTLRSHCRPLSRALPRARQAMNSVCWASKSVLKLLEGFEAILPVLLERTSESLRMFSEPLWLSFKAPGEWGQSGVGQQSVYRGPRWLMGQGRNCPL